nr:hypothetical protein Iba_chr12bCG22740 [Ipomoea batatas]
MPRGRHDVHVLVVLRMHIREKGDTCREGGMTYTYCACKEGDSGTAPCLPRATRFLTRYCIRQLYQPKRSCLGRTISSTCTGTE